MTEVFRIQYGEHPSQFGELRLPPNNGVYPVIVSIHGGFWQKKYSLDENTSIVEDLTQRGFATWNIEYRRLGEQGGGWIGTFVDIINAFNHLNQLENEFSLDLTSIVVLGHSAGGQLAIWLSALNSKDHSDYFKTTPLIPIRCVISLAGVMDLEKLWKIHEDFELPSLVAGLLDGTPKEVPSHYSKTSPIELIPVDIEQILIHGENDRQVPVEMSINYYNKALEKGARIHLEILFDTDHFMIIDPYSLAWNKVLESLNLYISNDKKER